MSRLQSDELKVRIWYVRRRSGVVISIYRHCAGLSSHSNLYSLQEKELEQARTDHEQLERLKAEMAEQESHWKEAYDVLMAENNALKSSGSEALLAAQWRHRYETCLAEKEDIETRLQMEVEKADAVADQRRKVDAGKYEAKYRDLKESFRLYRKKAKEIFEAQQRGDVAVSKFCLLWALRTSLTWRSS